MKHNTKIIIDSTSRILYASFYIQGLYETFGKKNVSFGRKHFKNLPRFHEPFSFNHYFAFVRVHKGKITRYIVDFCDPPDINKNAYEWCDIYAKINFDPTLATHNFKKLQVIPPSFGIRIWSLPKTIFLCVKNLIISYNAMPISYYKFMQDYWQQYQRLPIAQFLGNFEAQKENYVFFASTLWTERDNAQETNGYRRDFIKTCRSSKSLEFEGGLYANMKHPYYKEFEEVIIHKTYAFPEFLARIKKSIMVFNTPAVHKCHGWKLSEFLALGCSIISTKLSYDFSRPLIHGEHVHFISDSNEIDSVIQELIAKPDYRKKLALNAQGYFNQFMSPKEVIKSIIG